MISATELEKIRASYFEKGKTRGNFIAVLNRSDVSRMDFDMAMDRLIETENYDREYTPFEVLANEINSLDTKYNETGWVSTSVWTAYEEGIRAGIYETLVKERQEQSA